MKTLSHHVAKILPGWTDGVEDAGEITSRIFVWLDGFLVSIPCFRVRETLIKILFAGDLVFVERLELGDIAHRPPFIPPDALNLHIARGPDDKVAPFTATAAIAHWI